MEIRYSKQAIKFLAKQEESVRARIKAALQKLPAGDGWDAVEEEEPDEIDLQMISEAQNNPDCSVFASEGEVQAVLS